jgi:hypothetical protein
VLILVPDSLDGFLEHVQGYVGFVLRDYQGRANPDRAGPAAQEQNAALESHLDDAVALSSAVFLASLIFHDVDTDHQSTPTHIADQFQLRSPVRQALQHVSSDFG